MSEDVMVIPISWARAAAAAVAALVFAVVVMSFGRCGRPDATPLPANVQARVDRHAVASVVDTVQTHRLEQDTAQAGLAQRALAVAQRRIELTAAANKVAADSLAVVAAAAKTAQDSATAYHAAFDAEKAHSTTLGQALAASSAQLQAAAAHQAATDSIADIWKAHAIRGDSVIKDLTHVAEQRDQCKVAWIINCPTRTQAFVSGAVGGAVVGVVGTLVATGKIKVPVGSTGGIKIPLLSVTF